MLTILLALSLAAQDPDCRDPQYQAEMNRCAYLDFQAADRELNQIWPQMIAAARRADAEINREFDQAPTSEAALRNAQRAWITFRDEHCTYEGHEARGGSMETMLYEGCRATLTRQRIEQLRGLLEVR